MTDTARGIQVAFYVHQHPHSSDGDRIRTALLPAVPSQGQFIHIRAVPYVVLSVGWTLSEDDQLFAHIDVMAAGVPTKRGLPAP